MKGVTTCDYRSRAGIKLLWKTKCNITRLERTLVKLEYNVKGGTGRALMLKKE